MRPLPEAAPAEHELSVAGRPVRFRRVGRGPPLVLVHGLSGSWRWWRDVAPVLAERRTVYLVDLPRLKTLSRPRSVVSEAADWLVRWLGAADLGPAPLVGHSLGALVCARAAARAPGLVERIALIAPVGVPARGLIRSVVPLAVTLVRGPPAFLRTVAADALRAGPLELVRGARQALATDVRAELAAVESPLLIVWGRRDLLLPASLADEWCRALPRAELVILEAGHVPMFDAPRELAAVLLAFLG